MTVRAWFTISALALAALAAAFGWRFFLAPVDPPAVIVRSDEARHPGQLVAWCWPKRNGSLACSDDKIVPVAVSSRLVAAAGTLRLVVAFPVQPEEGTITITKGGEDVLMSDWTDELPYALGPGSYSLVAEARYPDGAFVRSAHAFRIENTDSVGVP